jgi:hypothetical protein
MAARRPIMTKSGKPYPRDRFGRKASSYRRARSRKKYSRPEARRQAHAEIAAAAGPNARSPLHPVSVYILRLLSPLIREVDYLPDFTFVCPNREDLERIAAAAESSRREGVWWWRLFTRVRKWWRRYAP